MNPSSELKSITSSNSCRRSLKFKFVALCFQKVPVKPASTSYIQRSQQTISILCLRKGSARGGDGGLKIRGREKIKCHSTCQSQLSSS